MPKLIAALALFVLTPAVPAQSPTTKQLMLDLIHPASNDILLIVNRGGPADEKDWASLRHSALTLQEAGSVLVSQNQSGDAWRKAAKMLADAAADAYKAAQTKDATALAAIAIRIDASCTSCHKQYRPNVFPGEAAK